ncbi:MAG: TIM barrel protein [Candidatus Atribacteria bacterium]|nr:TIM barrel protein [Candidatus Atribacteria bacterium]
MYPWHDTFHMGVIHFMAYPEATTQEKVVETVKNILKDEFFQAIEISALLPNETLGLIGKMCEVSKMELLLAGQPLILSHKLNLNALDESERQEALSECQGTIDKAYAVRSRSVSFLSGPHPEKKETENGKALLVDSLIELCRYAEKKSPEYGYLLGVNLEIFDHDVDKKALIGPAPDAADVAGKVKSRCPHFSLIVDLSHLPLLHEESLYTLSLLAPFIGHIHIGNGVLIENHPVYGDLHPRFGIPGGANDVNELVAFLQNLFRIHYFSKSVSTERPVISFEVKPLPGEDPDLVVANAKRTFLAAWNRLFPLVPPVQL